MFPMSLVGVHSSPATSGVVPFLLLSHREKSGKEFQSFVEIGL
jgi:hypothetical protein